MEEEFRKDLYQNYYSYHTKQLYGTITLSSIINQFEAWEFYYSEFLPIEKNIKILDAGCGYGGFVYWLTELGYSKVSGIDRSNEMIDLGKSLNINNISQVDIFEHLTITTNTYDLIFCRDVLEHLDKNEVYKIFKLFKNSLKENGALILQVPNGQSPFVGKILYGDFTHQNAFTESSLRQLIKSVEFNDIKVYESTPVPKNIISVIRLFIWKCVRIYLKFLQLIATGSGSGYFSPNIIAVIKK